MRDPRIDYTAGNFFITICLEERLSRFGKVVDGELRLNAAGELVQATWLALPQRIPGLVLDCHIVMPDHFHAVLGIVETKLTHPGCSAARPHLSDVVRVFKSLSTRAYGQGVREGLWPPYAGTLWQPGYWDHQLLSDAALEYHRNYVVTNPARWQLRRQGQK